MDRRYYSSASNSLIARTADRTPKTFALQGDTSRSTLPPSSMRSPYIVSPAGRDDTWNDLVHASVSPLLIEIIEMIPAPLRFHISSPKSQNLSPRWSPRSGWLLPVISYLPL
ncbi:hypothetical protein AVEN_168527-1 [Araneus ventricosus]|uniref:Uncharacterized protein n=1 Tax=Araneus ventricosus TaxID=182803 RepID=A0A4Y2E8W7_ARAVE|nr:hypothetical protein AVEN_33635-1 [Araneus ventricosus]GBM25691.1 hypothetical protein AVEN_168527-1 [Araneus ventricosus]